MTETRGFSYAPIVAAAFILWTPVGMFGGQGYSALLALAAIPAGFLVDWRHPSRPAICLLLLALWSGISGIWSAESDPLVSGSLTKGTFGVNAAGLRIVLTALGAALVLGACMRIKEAPGRAAIVILAALAVHGLETATVAAFPDMMLSAYAPFSDPVKEAPQNILRSANAFCLALPLLLTLCWFLKGWQRYATIAAALILATCAFRLIGSDVALLAVIFLALSWAVVSWLPQSGFRVLLGVVAFAIVFAPIILSTLGPAAVNSGLPLSASSKSRVFAWSLAAEKTRERPITGHGIEASKEWRETFSERPNLLALMKKSTDITNIPWENYRILPGHPHNMGLQLWAETGFIGVALAIATLFFLALAIPPPAALPPAIRFAAAGLIGTTFALFSLSYSVWNEAFWASVALAAAGIITVSKARLTP
ncbi:O-antigen ligase family protein [Henriciella aquimarina]|uniref:O-antigen ligase family protein n=1 Tax=Henriciella aquimarina TaxID=545261 RepID=UPI000A03AFB9|nr:O-antigen ligase family protein [Henriciella aquimarina]